MLAALTTLAAAVLGPLFGSALGATRRNRLVRRIRTYIALADQLEPHDAESAGVLREIASIRAGRLIALEHASLTRRVDPAALFAFALFILSAAIAAYFAWTRSGWWTWPVLLISGAWAAIVLAASRSEFWKEREEIAEVERELEEAEKAG